MWLSALTPASVSPTVKGRQWSRLLTWQDCREDGWVPHGELPVKDAPWDVKLEGILAACLRPGQVRGGGRDLETDLLSWS